MSRKTTTNGILVTAAGLVLALLLVSGATPINTGGDPQAGKQDFVSMCARCHNDDGEGDGPEYTRYLPQPANLTLVRNSPAMFASIIQNGIPGTGMPAFAGHPAAGVNNMYAYMVNLAVGGRREFERLWVPDQPRYASAAANVYITECSGCHGLTGAGDGFWAQNDPHIFPKPANLRARNSDVGRVYRIIRLGRQGAMMPPQVFKIPPGVMWDLAFYVAAMYDPNSPAQIQSGTQTQYQNPLQWNDQNALAAGEQHFNLYCAGCHNANAMGTFLAPAMHDRWWYYGGGSDNAVFSVVSKGIPGQLMPSHAVLPPELRWSIITYVRSQGGLPDPLLPAKQYPSGGVPPGTVSNEVTGVK